MSERFCACGCGAAVPPSHGPNKRIYATPTCRRRALYQRHGSGVDRDEFDAKVAATRQRVYGSRDGRPSVEEVRARLERECPEALHGR